MTEEYAAQVLGRPVPKDRVDVLLDAVPARDRETRPEALARAERQRRRWATQVVVIDELARRACAQRSPRGAGNCATSHDGAAPEKRPTTALPTERDVADLGSIVAVALAHSPAARTLLEQLERDQQIPEEAAYDYYDRNRDRFLTPAELTRGADPFHETSDLLPYAQVREGILIELRRAAGRRAFFDWLDRARADVVYAPGYEHPGDPSHPDHEHRH
ncbi:peptidyl-prolyl cis-trans isomerase [Streptomyces sp. NBC_00124]|uniref:peptidyl-prolyl cis-trans isomerase n=1 Tax=Streptomyces sp. NBC_00124 TaxID=2975662 RepID=UPI0022533C58|nr:peptidyl-prolyl cis-trans isomerase [Streptomyces sp. NBC_00124]MCX5360073.1 peptidyl-prolyl cis-trans isomerase [Streptomyces sp. NBC_00124]